MPEWILSIFLGLMLFFVFSEVIYRLILDRSLLWTEELSRYLFLWTIYIGAVVAYNKGSHVRIEILVRIFPAYWQKRINYFVQILSLIFLIIVLYYGRKIVFLNFNMYSDILEIPMGYIYSIVPISATIMSALIVKIILFGKEKKS